MSINILPEQLVAELESAALTADPFVSVKTLSLPFLNGQALTVSFYPDTVLTSDAREVLARLMEVSSDLRTSAATLIWDDLQMMIEARQEDYETLEAMLEAEGEGRGFDDLRPPRSKDDLWPLLQFREIFLDKSVDGEAFNAILVADVAWDMEHKIGLFFRDGDVLVAATDPSTGV